MTLNTKLTMGRRKNANARAVLSLEPGPILVNGQPIEEFFQPSLQPILARIPNLETYSGNIWVNGGGITSQAESVCLAIAKSIRSLNPSISTELKHAGLLTTDARRKERKKYGLKKARKAPQYSKR